MDKDLLKLEKGDGLCVMCKFGHGCPYFEENEDMLHAVLFKSEEVKTVGAKLEFWTNGCNKFVDCFARDIGDEAGGKMIELIKELKRLRVTRRGRFSGMWIPYVLYDAVIIEAERCENHCRMVADSRGNVDSLDTIMWNTGNVRWDVAVRILYLCCEESRSNYGVRLNIDFFNDMIAGLERYAKYLRLVDMNKGIIGELPF